MRLISFNVKNMHGYIDVDIRFKDGLSIIVGGNGSGKTSALSLLASVLRVEAEEILKTKFDEVELRYEALEKRRQHIFTLTIKQINNIYTINLHRGGELISQQKLNSKSSHYGIIDFSSIEFTRVYDDIRRTLSINVPEKTGQKDIPDKVEIGAKVTFVRLDRSVSAIDSHGGVSFEEPDSKKEIVSRNPRKGQLRDPLEVVRDVTMSKYVSYRNRLEEIKAKTYDQLFRIHFSESDIAQESSFRLDRLEKKLLDLEEKLEASSSILHFSEFKQYIQNTKMINKEVQIMKAERKTGRKTRLEEVLSSQLISRSQKIESLLSVFYEESKDSTLAYDALSTYLITLNDFLKDSGKQLSFSQADNNLYFSRIGQPLSDNSASKELNRLSSGEKQIVIMLTYLAFLAEPGSIFIVDEPELSLHLKWQSALVEALLTLCPRDCQIVLATHAPEIAGKARESCVRLKYLERA